MSRTGLQGCICPQCVVDDDVRATHGRWIELMSLFNERQARLYAAEKAMALGHGGITLVSEVLGLSERTIRRGSRSWRREIWVRCRKEPAVLALDGKRAKKSIRPSWMTWNC